MQEVKFFKRSIACALALFLSIPWAGQIEAAVAAEGFESIFKPEELEQILAPIALYPDALLAQVLAAATYPLEIVEAHRFIKANPGLQNEALLEAAKEKDWEPSIKAMLEFPDVLALMDEQLEWTKKLGDAVLIQQADCMDAIQRLRQKAYAQGNLVTSEKQVIRVKPQTQIIVIEPASPKVIYVPVYDTAIIYGRWCCPKYPPYYFYPVRYSGIVFFPRVFVGAFWGIWSCNWYSRNVYININLYKTFSKTRYVRSDYILFYKSSEVNQPWRHNPKHRQSVKYKKQPPGLAVRSSISGTQKDVRGTMSPPTIISRKSASKAINATKRVRGNQQNLNRLPAQTSRGSVVSQAGSKAAARINSANAQETQENQRGPRTSTRNAKPRRNAETPISTNNQRGDIRDRVINRTPSNRSSREEGAEHVLAANNRGRKGSIRSNNAQPSSNTRR